MRQDELFNTIVLVLVTIALAYFIGMRYITMLQGVS
jgi:hypothetical protein